MRLSPFVCLASGISKTYRSLLLALSSSTIKKPSEYIVLTPRFVITASLLKRFPIHSSAKEIRIKTGTPRRLVPIVALRIRSLLVICNRTYQSSDKSSAR
jgi:hypothetical protein